MNIAKNLIAILSTRCKPTGPTSRTGPLLVVRRELERRFLILRPCGGVEVADLRRKALSLLEIQGGVVIIETTPPEDEG